MAYVNRFITNCRLKTDKDKRKFGPLTTQELDQAFKVLIVNAQKQSFQLDYKNLVNSKSLSKESRILCLNPFMDNSQIIRVSGRLKNTNYSFDKIHPIILCSKHKLTTLILHQEHHRLLHCGAQQLLASIRERFWPISGRNACKEIIRKCVTCFKAKPSSNDYLMGNLPSNRVNQDFPFNNVGLDYAGPFIIKDRITRGAKFIKVYICIFICMCTKAIHLDLVCDLSTESFLQTLKRFIARRGLPSNIFSDNATTFVGANNHLKDLYKFLLESNEEIRSKLISQNISWHFIPARSPHFGGLWEAGVKSLKYHLRRVLRETKLGYNSMYTLLTQIEAILNSRPLTPLSSDPSDLNTLTPAHFLIGRSLTSLPKNSLSHIPENRLTKLQHLEKLRQHFWTRWHKEYLGELQSRTKWRRPMEQDNLIGKLVLIKDDNLPPLKWRLGRITDIHPGNDGVVRVVTLMGPNGELKRALNKVCILPINNEIS
ncbi:uncharacterized protein LOC113387879 [Ctenocephalides felis]|uniref:uncharacterized protein LOC113387879 n=1 Tax=Ctenocephalides felis TaxID=7515 RepID=UPI000E6E285B|nr:uncharacterized protein LOC113387879 [Ctenocephalides felis]